MLAALCAAGIFGLVEWIFLALLCMVSSDLSPAGLTPHPIPSHHTTSHEHQHDLPCLFSCHLPQVWYVVQFIDSPVRQHARDWWAPWAFGFFLVHVIHWILTLVSSVTDLI